MASVAPTVDSTSPAPRGRGRWRRRLATLGLLALLLPLVGWLAFHLALGNAGIRQTLLQRLSGVTQESLGASFTADDFLVDLDPLADRVRVELLGLRLVASGAPTATGDQPSRPFLTAERVTIEVLGLRALLSGGPIHLGELAISSPRFDRGAPLPVLPASQPGDPPPRHVQIDRLTVAGGEVVPGAVEQAAAQSSPPIWSLSDLTASGRVSGSDFELDQLTGALTVDDLPALPRVNGVAGASASAHAPRRLVLQLATAASLRDGELTLTSPLVATGDGLTLNVKGKVNVAGGDAGAPTPSSQGSLTPGLPRAVGTFRLELDPQQLLGTEASGAVALEGSFDHQRVRPLELRGDVHGLLVADLVSYLPANLADQLAPRLTSAEMEGATFDAAVDLALTPLPVAAAAPSRAAWTNARGSVDVVVRGAADGSVGVPLLEVQIRRPDVDSTTASAASAVQANPSGNRSGDELALEVALLPQSAGERRLSGELVTGAIADPATWVWSAGKLTWKTPQVLSEVRRLAALVGVDDPLATSPGGSVGFDQMLAGAVDLELLWSGPLTAPRSELNARLLPESGGELRLAATFPDPRPLFTAAGPQLDQLAGEVEIELDAVATAMFAAPLGFNALDPDGADDRPASAADSAFDATLRATGREGRWQIAGDAHTVGLRLAASSQATEALWWAARDVELDYDLTLEIEPLGSGGGSSASGDRQPGFAGLWSTSLPEVTARISAGQLAQGNGASTRQRVGALRLEVTGGLDPGNASHSNTPKTASQLPRGLRLDRLLLEAASIELAVADPNAAPSPARTADVASVGEPADETAGLAEQPFLAGPGAIPPWSKIDRLRVEGRLRDERLTISALDLATPYQRLEGAGWVNASWPLSAAALELSLTAEGSALPLPPATPLGDLELVARLVDGSLSLVATGAGGPAGAGRIAGLLPLAAVDAAWAAASSRESAGDSADVGLSDFVAGPLADGPLALAVDLPRLDSAGLFAAFGLATRPESFVLAGSAALLLDPTRPSAARGEVVVQALAAAIGEHQLSFAAVDDPQGSPLRAWLGERRLVLAPVEVVVDGQRVELAGAATLAAEGYGIEWVSAELAGEVGAALLDPYLGGGAGRGQLQLAGRIDGPPETLGAAFELTGPTAIFFWPTPYAVRLQAPQLAGRLVGDVVHLDQGAATVNGGQLRLQGQLALPAVGGLDAERVMVEGRPLGVKLAIELADVAASLDHGLLARLGADLDLSWTGDAPGKPAGGLLAGDIVVERALLERDIDLDRTLALDLLIPPDQPTTAASALEGLALDLRVETVEGVRVRNNVADLRASWASPLEVSGTAALPVLRGELTVDPGGLVFAFGQIVRLDHASVRYTGDPSRDPEIEASTTSSLVDPSLRQAVSSDLLAALDDQGSRAESELELADRLGLGVAGYYGDRLVSQLGERLGLGRVSLRPVLVFGEADPSARLTVARDLSRVASVAWSLDLRNPERQTYLLDLHGFAALPSFTLQGFTRDGNTEGATLQQTLELGGTRIEEPDAPRVDRVTIVVVDEMGEDAAPPAGFPRRRLRRALDLARGTPLPAGRLIDLEARAAGLLRSRGYPDVEVVATTTPSQQRSGQLDVRLAVRPGQPTVVRFAGSKLPRASRRAITGLFRGEAFAEAAASEMKARAVRGLRSRGFLSPVVEIAEVTGTWSGRKCRVDNGSQPQPGADACRQVTVTAIGGEKVDVESVAVAGVAPDAAVAVAGRFAAVVERLELLAGEEAAKRRVEETLRRQGYPQAALQAVELTGTVLHLEVAAGTRRFVDRVEVVGLPVGEESLAAGLDLVAGAAARRDRLVGQAVVLERALRRRGFADAKVSLREEIVERQSELPAMAGVEGESAPVRPQPTAATSTPGEEPVSAATLVVVYYDVAPGSLVILDEITYNGLRHTPEPLVRRLAGLIPEFPHDPAAVERAQRTLYGLGNFSRVSVGERRNADGKVELTIDLVERPRWTVGYGARWDTEVGLSAVVDVADRNLFGHGITLGGRALYEEKDQSGRLYLAVPRLFGPGLRPERIADDRNGEATRRRDTTLELFVEVRHREQPEVNLVEDWQELTLQLARPFGAFGTARIYGRHRRTLINEIEPDPFFPSFEIELVNRFAGVQVLWDSRDEPLLPNRGRFASADLSGSGEWLGSDLAYTRFYGQLNSFWRWDLGRLPVVLGQSLRLGLAEPEGGQTLVRDLRFFAGGPTSVRGFALDSLGPIERLGSFIRPAGGGAVVVTNHELRVGLPYGLWAVAFVDAGQVWPTIDDLDTDLAFAGGLGVRAALPIGILRLDIAWPAEPRVDDDKQQIYVGFGTTF